MTFDGTITLGNILTICGMVGTTFVFIMSVRSQLDVVKSEIKSFVSRLDKIEGAMSKLTDALVQLAKQEVRLDSHADRLKRLEGEH